MSSMRVAVVGCGGIAQSHLEAYRTIEGMEVVGLSDLNREAAEKTARAFGVGAYFTDVDEMIEKQRPDLVCILVPYPAHCACVEAVACHGVHILCQKPMAGTREEVDRMIRAADEAGVQLCINENYRHLKPFVLAKEAISAGRIGDLALMRYEEVLFWPEPPPMYQRLQPFYNIEMGPHYFDSMCWLSGRKARRVYGAVRRLPTIKCAGDNLYCCQVEFDGGLIARVDDTVALPGRNVRDRVYIYGTKGTLAINAPEGGFAVYDAANDRWETTDIGDRRENWVQSFRRPMEEFLAALRAGRPAPLPASEYKHVMDIAFAVYDSSQTGQAIELGKRS